MRTLMIATVVVLLGCRCAAPQAPAEPGPDAGPAAATPDAGQSPDAGLGVDAGVAPTRWPAPVDPVTHDIDADLSRVLESAALDGACAKVKAGATDRATRLQCGKWMFFYETYGTVGIPLPLLEFNQKHFGDSFFGKGFSNLGLVPDPASTTGMPLGLAPTTGKLGSVETRAFTCASCHFGQLPDGRYAVGYGNLKLDYGLLIASLGAPLSLSFNANDPKVTQSLRDRLAGPVAAAKAQSGFTVEAGVVGLQLLGTGSTAANLSLEEQDRFLKLRTGTMDFLTKPLVDDGVWTVSRILSLWNLPDAAQRQAAQMPHERLSWNAGVPTLTEFLTAFVIIGVGKNDWPPERLAPLAEYLMTLRAPELLGAPDAAQVASGAALFVSKGCLACHLGPSGEGNRPFTFDEMGTDRAYAGIYSPLPSGAPCCGLGDDPANVTRGVKAPRLTGVASQRRFLHNGSVGSLEELFCLSPRDSATDLAQTSGGHLMTCDGLSQAEKISLISYLQSL